MPRLKQFLEKRPALQLHYDHEGRFAAFANEFRIRIPKVVAGRLGRLIIDAAADLPGVSALLLENQLGWLPLVSFADHAGLLNYQILYSANLLMSAMLMPTNAVYQIVLATGRIPFDNISHPRGFIFHGVKHHFFPSKIYRTPVCLYSEGIKATYDKQLGSILRPESLKLLNSEERKYLQFLFFEQIDVCNVATMKKRFVDQLALLNGNLWSCHFSKDLRSQQTRMLYLSADDLVKKMIIEDVVDEKSLLHRILFNPTVRAIYLEEFSGITGCWTNYSGTHFFWGVGETKSLHAMRLNSNGTQLLPLRSEANNPSIPMTPDAVKQAILDNHLIPSLFLDILFLAFIEGYTLLGGFNQVTYLAWMRVAHERCMLRLGDWPMAARFARTPTDGLICGPLPFPQWESSLDMIWEKNSTNGKFNGNLDGGLTRQELDDMRNTPMKQLIQNGVDAMLDVVE